MIELGYEEKRGRWLLIKTPYNEDFLNFLKEHFYPALFDRDRKLWKIAFNPDNYKLLSNWIGHKELRVGNSVHKALIDHRARINNNKINTNLEQPAELWPFQRQALAFIKACNGRAILAADMGLGKTVIAIFYIKEINPSRVLILCPNSVKFNWKLELDKWTNLEAISVNVRNIDKANLALKNGGIVIANYELAHKLKPSKSDLLILDEFHLIKNPKARRTTIVSRQIAPFFDKVLCLSGTPMPNRPEELFPALKILDAANWFSFVDYALSYCNGHYKYFGNRKVLISNGASHLNELKEKLKPYMWIARKEQVLNQLPDLRRLLLNVEIMEAERYQALEDDVKEELYVQERLINNLLNDIRTDAETNLLMKINSLQRLAAELKAKALTNWILNYLKTTGEALVIYSIHLSVIDILKETLQGVKLVEITGRTPIKEREAIITDFNEGKYQVLLMSKVGTLGINLTGASTAIFMERDWTPANEEQAECRLHRPGQKKNVTIWYAFAPGTIDEDFAAVLEWKNKVINKVINSNIFYGKVAEHMLQRNER